MDFKWNINVYKERVLKIGYNLNMNESYFAQYQTCLDLSA